MKPISLEIVTGMITTFGHCRHCEIFFDEAGIQQKARQTEIEDYPPDLIQECDRLFDWVGELKRLYKHRLSIRLIDAKSFVGFYKSLRHRIRKYPTFIVEGKESYTGWDRKCLEDLLDKYIKASLVLNRQSA